MAGFRDKRDLNRYQRTSFASSGRSAGSGILYDRYDDESGRPIYYSKTRPTLPEPKGEYEARTRPGPVKRYFINKEEAIKL